MNPSYQNMILCKEMAKFLGIDYGSKKIGLAVSDDGGEFSFPEAVIVNDTKTLQVIKELCTKLGIERAVLGESLNLSGEPNKLMAQINEFKKKLEEELGLKVFSEKEFMTSSTALHMDQYMKGIRPDTARKVKREVKEVDASAAALILQRYLDRNKK